MRNNLSYNRSSLAVKPAERTVSQPKRQHGGLHTVTWKSIQCLLLALILVGSGVGFRFRYQQIKERNKKTIELLQRDLDQAREKNDMKESAIKKKMDLEKIQKIAVDKLGMEPVKQDQIIRYETTADDYFHVLKTK